MYSRWMREWLLKKRYTEKGFIQTDTKKKQIRPNRFYHLTPFQKSNKKKTMNSMLKYIFHFFCSNVEKK